MAVPSLKRSLGFASLGSTLVLAVVLSACGDDGDSTQPTIVIQPSTFSTIVSTTAPAAAAEGGGAAPAGGTVAGTQVYEVKSNDFLGEIADDYGIPPESIANFNQWEDGVQHVIHPGDTINIPPGAQVPSEDDEDDEESADTADESDESEATEEEPEEEAADPDDDPRCADGSRQGTYTIEAGDFPGAVAESLDVTVDQLNEANANTSGYSSFYEGLEILVPCGDEDE
jgi:LysM repeat protein